MLSVCLQKETLDLNCTFTVPVKKGRKTLDGSLSQTKSTKALGPPFSRYMISSFGNPSSIVVSDEGRGEEEKEETRKLEEYYSLFPVVPPHKKQTQCLSTLPQTQFRS